jgi:hypothetical protein
LLVQPAREAEVLESERWSPLRAQPVTRVTDYRKQTVVLMRVGDR